MILKDIVKSVKFLHNNKIRKMESGQQFYQKESKSIVTRITGERNV